MWRALNNLTPSLSNRDKVWPLAEFYAFYLVFDFNLHISFMLLLIGEVSDAISSSSLGLCSVCIDKQLEPGENQSTILVNT